MPDSRTLAALRQAAWTDPSDAPFYRDALLEAGEDVPAWLKRIAQEARHVSFLLLAWFPVADLPDHFAYYYSQSWRSRRRFGVRKYLRPAVEWLPDFPANETA